MHLHSLEKASSNLLENRKVDIVPRHMNGQFKEKKNKKNNDQYVYERNV